MSRRGTPPSRSRRSRGQRQRRDERPYLVVLFVLLVVIGAMALGPLRSLAAANDRVDQLTHERDVLADEVGVLEEQSEDLNDPTEQEVYARNQLGMVMPGEVPYVVLPDEDDGAAEAEPSSEEVERGDRSWYERLADAVSSLFGQ